MAVRTADGSRREKPVSDESDSAPIAESGRLNIVNIGSHFNDSWMERGATVYSLHGH